MRIAYVTADHGIPVFGDKGASIHIQEMVRALAGLGHEVTIFAARVGANPDRLPAEVHKVWAESAAEGFEEEERRTAKERRALAIGNQVMLDLEARHAIAPFDLIYERYSLWSAAAVRAGRSLGVPVVVEVNAPLIVEQQQYRELVLGDDAEAIEREVFDGADALAAVSADIRTYAVEKGAHPSRVHVVPNGVDLARFHTRVAAAPTGVPDGRFVIGFAGSLKPWHGVDILMDAFALLCRRGVDGHLLLIGDGPMRAWVEGYANGARLLDRITITGWVPYGRLPGLLARVDAAAAPYPPLERFYFSPLKVYEYLAMGLPMVASAVGQITTLISDGETGLLTRPGDAADLAKKIERLHDDCGLREAVGRSAARAARDHSWRRAAETITGLAAGLRRAA